MDSLAANHTSTLVVHSSTPVVPPVVTSGVDVGSGPSLAYCRKDGLPSSGNLKRASLSISASSAIQSDLRDPISRSTHLSPSHSCSPKSPPFSILPVPSASVVAESGSLNGGETIAPSDALVVATAAAALNDEPMELPLVDTVSPAPADTRPTMAELLQSQEVIRRDKAVIDALRNRIETPKPLARDIESIERQYAAGRDWSFVSSRIDQARPYELPRKRYDMVIDTGRTFAKTPLQKIMSSLTGSHHGNDALEKLYGDHAIDQVSKLPGGNLRVKMKTNEACL
ncbi:uncharacterized protein PHALS_05446 [Plasmopara halstedii]|uniref:Uncharacterized protein n=1 Tax=Plasmopara halstedii TaxID=4781 RepID=A0A0P1B2C4_PLAHL|nr:uncharacterized protein PHALS_05446 [Plasmopara halstedii]CEG47962.1 hypothetical protein PHALS_05446 [Plasmopara halstedii]|eukprot:XP_024584331.1 hypothetical protein PHALS_05446 [Plasmopara halstedii]